jgi:hypothetical protein
MLQATPRLQSAAQLLERYQSILGAEVDWRSTRSIDARFRVFWRANEDRQLCKLL